MPHRAGGTSPRERTMNSKPDRPQKKKNKPVNTTGCCCSFCRLGRQTVPRIQLCTSVTSTRPNNVSTHAHAAPVTAHSLPLPLSKKMKKKKMKKKLVFASFKSKRRAFDLSRIVLTNVNTVFDRVECGCLPAAGMRCAPGNVGSLWMPWEEALLPGARC